MDGERIGPRVTSGFRSLSEYVKAVVASTRASRITDDRLRPLYVGKEGWDEEDLTNADDSE